MNSERRHELQQNELAIYLDRLNKSIEPYSRIIAVVVGVSIIGAIALAFYNSEQTGQRSIATFDLIQASASQDAEVLLTVSDNYPDTVAGAWARLYQGRQYLVQGIQALYNDRESAEELLGDAQAAFKNAISSSNDPLLLSRAHYGIARAQESLGNIDGAIDAYREVIAVNESEAMVKKTEERIETLSKPQTKEFLAWFSDQDFSPADPSLPPSLFGGDALSDSPDIKLPALDLPKLELPGFDLPSGDNQELSDGGIEMPQKDSTKGPENASSTEGDSSNTDDNPTEDTPTAAEDTPAAAEDTPAAAEDTPAAAEETPTADKQGSAEPLPAETANDDSAGDSQ